MFSYTIFICVLLVTTISAISIHGVQDEVKKPFMKFHTLNKLQLEDPEFYYLPETMIPESYEITLEPHIDQNSFDGEVIIIGTNQKPLTEIVMHVLEIEIFNVWVNINGITIEHSENYDREREFLIIQLAVTVPKNSDIVIVIKYSGVMNDQNEIHGLYIATYIDEFGREKRMVTSHNQPTHARRIFPCFDEPALKAKFRLIIVRPRAMNSKSNMPLAGIEGFTKDDSKQVDFYHPTPPMSTYLVVVVVSEFATITLTGPDQILHEFHGDIADIRKNYSELALSSSGDVIAALEHYTGVTYDLPKIGQVAIPRGFFDGAMENWGLVVYDEDELLFKPTISSEITRNGAVQIIAHEYAHQWFGNLVSPATWAYTWLNEGFAAYFTLRIPAVLYPEWRYDEQFAWQIPEAMTFDGSPDTRPMTMPVGSPENIFANFDSIAYAKSSCVIRMFEHALGTNKFKKALNIYLNKRKYKAATADDLISSFEDVLKENNPNLAGLIRKFFDSWHLQKGFPLVTAIRDYQYNTVTFYQERFINDGSESDEIYSIPINYFLQSSSTEEKADTSTYVWLTQKSMTIELPEEAKSSYLILNKGYIGYYRVNYDVENWQRIYKNDRSFLDMPKNRVQILDDAFVLMKSGKLSDYVALRLFSAIQDRDDNYLVIKASLQYFDWLYEWYHADEDIMHYLSGTFRQAYNTFSYVEFDGDYIETLTRNELFPRMCRINNQVCLSDMGKYIWHGSALASPNLQESVVCAGLMNTTDAEVKFKMITNRILYEKEEEISDRLKRALTCTKDTEMGKVLLNWIVYPETNLLKYRVFTLMKDYCRDYENSKRALTHYLENFNILSGNYGYQDLRHLLTTIANKLNSPEDVQTIESFLASGLLPGDYVKIFDEALDIIRENISQIKPLSFKRF